MIEKATITMPVKSLVRRYTRGDIDFNNVIQRNEVWDNYRKSLFVHSMMMNYVIPPVFAQDIDGKLSILDGKQRMTTAIRFVSDEFELHPETPSVTYTDNKNDEDVTIDVAGMKFSDLPEELQDTIMQFDFLIYKLRGMTDDERDEMFIRQNMGMPLTKMELTRAMASGHVMEFVNEIANSEFFTTAVNLSEKSINRYVHHEIVLQILMLLDANGPTSISGDDLQNFAKHLKENGLDEEIKATVRSVVAYLSEAIPEKINNLRKIHVPMIFMTAMKAMDDEIPATQFGGWAQGFFKRLRKKNREKHFDLWVRGTQSGSAKAENVKFRLEAVMKDYELYIHESDDFKPSEANENSSNTNRSGRGRRKKAQEESTGSQEVIPEAERDEVAKENAESTEEVTEAVVTI